MALIVLAVSILLAELYSSQLFLDTTLLLTLVEVLLLVSLVFFLVCVLFFSARRKHGRCAEIGAKGEHERPRGGDPLPPRTVLRHRTRPHACAQVLLARARHPGAGGRLRHAGEGPEGPRDRVRAAGPVFGFGEFSAAELAYDGKTWRQNGPGTKKTKRKKWGVVFYGKT